MNAPDGFPEVGPRSERRSLTTGEGADGGQQVSPAARLDEGSQPQSSCAAAGETPGLSWVWRCPNCLGDWPEPFCDLCGRNLAVAMPALTEPDARAAEVLHEGAERGGSTPSDLSEAARSASGSVSVRHLTVAPDPAPPHLRLLNDIARDDWSRRV